jgi:hypothetical protein
MLKAVPGGIRPQYAANAQNDVTNFTFYKVYSDEFTLILPRPRPRNAYTTSPPLVRRSRGLRITSMPYASPFICPYL